MAGNHKGYWRYFNGEEVTLLPIDNSDEFSDEHLQRAYKWAEGRYLTVNKEIDKLADKSMVLYDKLRELEDEAEQRGMDLQSISDYDPEKDSSKMLINNRVYCKINRKN